MSETREQNESGASPRELSFTQFVFMQYQQAKLTLGDFPNPMTGKYEVQLPVAQYSISVLAMLEEKTKGNLSKDEAALLENALTELRLAYVHKKREIERKQQEAERGSEAKPRENMQPDREGSSDNGHSAGQ